MNKHHFPHNRNSVHLLSKAPALILLGHIGHAWNVGAHITANNGSKHACLTADNTVLSIVQLANSVEGLVHISNMNDDYYEFNERDMLMIGTRTGKVYRIGEAVKVKVIGADTDNYQIDFQLEEDEPKKPDESRRARRRKKQDSSKKERGPRRGSKDDKSKNDKDKGKGRFKGRRKTKKPGKKRK